VTSTGAAGGATARAPRLTMTLQSYASRGTFAAVPAHGNEGCGADDDAATATRHDLLAATMADPTLVPQSG
jgi:hypothetical protein